MKTQSILQASITVPPITIQKSGRTPVTQAPVVEFKPSDLNLRGTPRRSQARALANNPPQS